MSEAHQETPSSHLEMYAYSEAPECINITRARLTACADPFLETTNPGKTVVRTVSPAPCVLSFIASSKASPYANHENVYSSHSGGEFALEKQSPLKDFGRVPWAFDSTPLIAVSDRVHSAYLTDYRFDAASVRFSASSRSAYLPMFKLQHLFPLFSV